MWKRLRSSQRLALDDDDDDDADEDATWLFFCENVSKTLEPAVVMRESGFTLHVANISRKALVGVISPVHQVNFLQNSNLNLCGLPPLELLATNAQIFMWSCDLLVYRYK